MPYSVRFQWFGVPVSAIELVTAVRVSTEHAGDLRDHGVDLQHLDEPLVRAQPCGAAGGAADPIVVLEQGPMPLDLDLEASVVEFPRVCIGGQLEQEREWNDPGDESLGRRKVPRLLPEHSPDRLVGAVSEPGFDRVQAWQAGQRGCQASPRTGGGSPAAANRDAVPAVAGEGAGRRR